ncbi:MAG: non-heme iron oxygenase ferredoxin subunit [Gammaproteobacteria bacterium]|nr:non-heme iron oxygenase ferredoxin subunit [Gammaproteobacteria bacterium]
MAFVQACSTADVEPGEAFLFDYEGQGIAIVNLDNQFFALDDRCSHDNWSLCDGYVEGEEIVCSLHMARFCVRTGEVRMPPAYEPLSVYPVKVEGTEVWVDPDGGTTADG